MSFDYQGAIINSQRKADELKQAVLLQIVDRYVLVYPRSTNNQAAQPVASLVELNTGMGANNMQAWDQVKVINAESEHVGRAGVVESYDPATSSNLVKLDENGTQAAVHAVFVDADLHLLGR